MLIFFFSVHHLSPFFGNFFVFDVRFCLLWFQDLEATKKALKELMEEMHVSQPQGLVRSGADACFFLCIIISRFSFSYGYSVTRTEEAF